MAPPFAADLLRAFVAAAHLPKTGGNPRAPADRPVNQRPALVRPTRSGSPAPSSVSRALQLRRATRSDCSIRRSARLDGLSQRSLGIHPGTARSRARLSRSRTCFLTRRGSVSLTQRLIDNLPGEPAADVGELLRRLHRRPAVLRANRALVPPKPPLNSAGLDERLRQTARQRRRCCPISSVNSSSSLVRFASCVDGIGALELRLHDDPLERELGTMSPTQSPKSPRASGAFAWFGSVGLLPEHPIRVAVALVRRPCVDVRALFVARLCAPHRQHR